MEEEVEPNHAEEMVVTEVAQLLGREGDLAPGHPAEGVGRRRRVRVQRTEGGDWDVDPSAAHTADGASVHVDPIAPRGPDLGRVIEQIERAS